MAQLKTYISTLFALKKPAEVFGLSQIESSAVGVLLILVVAFLPPLPSWLIPLPGLPLFALALFVLYASLYTVAFKIDFSESHLAYLRYLRFTKIDFAGLCLLASIPLCFSGLIVLFFFGILNNVSALELVASSLLFLVGMFGFAAAWLSLERRFSRLSKRRRNHRSFPLTRSSGLLQRDIRLGRWANLANVATGALLSFLFAAIVYALHGSFFLACFIGPALMMTMITFSLYEKEGGTLNYFHRRYYRIEGMPAYVSKIKLPLLCGTVFFAALAIAFLVTGTLTLGDFALGSLMFLFAALAQIELGHVLLVRLDRTKALSPFWQFVYFACAYLFFVIFAVLAIRLLIKNYSERVAHVS